MNNSLSKFRIIIAFVSISSSIFISCASTPQVSGLKSLDEATREIATGVAERVQSGNSVAIIKIESPLPLISNFISNELEKHLNFSGKMDIIVRGEALESIINEHNFQMSGMVSDESIVGIGHIIGANVVISGDFERYTNFNALYIRAVEVRTARVLGSYSVRIDNKDPVLIGITASLAPPKGIISEEALEYYNRGRDYLFANIPDIAIEEFNKALGKNRNYAEAYFYRGRAYSRKGDHNRAIADFTSALRYKPDYKDAYLFRGNAYVDSKNFDRAIADFTAGLRLDDNDAWLYGNRAFAYWFKGDLDRCIIDCEIALRIGSNIDQIDDMWRRVQRDRGKSWYTRAAFINFDIDFRNEIGGILPYNGYRISDFDFWDTFNEYIRAYDEYKTTKTMSAIIPGYFLYQVEPPERLVTPSFDYGINPDLDERIKTVMRRNNITVCTTSYPNEHGGFTYVVNYSFDNHNTFGTVSMDSVGYVQRNSEPHTSNFDTYIPQPAQNQDNNSATKVKFTPRFDNAENTKFGLFLGYYGSFNFNLQKKYGFTLSWDDYVPYEKAFIGSLAVDYFHSEMNPVHTDALILAMTVGYQMFSKYTLYGGGGVGVGFPVDDKWFAWKANGGLRLQIGKTYSKFDVSYGTILGLAFGIGWGIFL